MKPSAPTNTPVRRSGWLSRLFGRRSAAAAPSQGRSRLLAAAAAFSLLAGGLAAPDAAHAAKKKKAKAKRPVAAASAARTGHGPIPASIVIDVDTNRVLNSFNADQRIYPASTTKLMTLYLVFDGLKSGRLRLDQNLTVSANAAAQPRTSLALRTGNTITVENAMRGLMVHSANDAAVVLGEALGGSRAGFARMMNDKARQLGMGHSAFFNANGLGDPSQQVTASDMARLMTALFRDHPEYAREYLAIPSFTYNGTTYTNTNRLLGSERCPGIIGGKTGYIRASGTNIVVMAERNNHRVVVGVFGRPTGAIRNDLTCNLINFAYFKMLRDPAATYDADRLYEVVMPPAPQPATPAPFSPAPGTSPAPLLPAPVPAAPVPATVLFNGTVPAPHRTAMAAPRVPYTLRWNR